MKVIKVEDLTDIDIIDDGETVDIRMRASIIDAVPVVRCKDCVCGEERVDKNRLTYLFCTFAQHPTVKHNYCVWGERKDNGMDS